MIWGPRMEPLRAWEGRQPLGLAFLSLRLVLIGESHSLCPLLSVFTGLGFLMGFETPHHAEPAADHRPGEERPLKGTFVDGALGRVCPK